MRVLVGPRLDLKGGGVVAAAAHALAGPDTVLSLRHVGVRNLSRQLSPAEVALLREALAGRDHPGLAGAAPGPRPVVGYVCRGIQIGPLAHLVVVTDHANLTWRSPLTGPNDDCVGPRFPSVTGVYAPDAVLGCLKALEGMIVVSGAVAGVRDDCRLTAFEAEVAGAQGYPAASSELVPVAIVAAHMGLRVAAVVVTEGLYEKESDSGRS